MQSDVPIWVLQLLQIATWPAAVVAAAFIIRSAILGWARSTSHVQQAQNLRAHIDAIERRITSAEGQDRLVSEVVARFDPAGEAVRIANAVPEIPPVAREKMKPRLQEYLRDAVYRSSRLATGGVLEMLRNGESGRE